MRSVTCKVNFPQPWQELPMAPSTEIIGHDRHQFSKIVLIYLCFVNVLAYTYRTHGRE
jgi:hypothetical protein